MGGNQTTWRKPSLAWGEHANSTQKDPPDHLKTYFLWADRANPCNLPTFSFCPDVPLSSRRLRFYCLIFCRIFCNGCLSFIGMMLCHRTENSSCRESTRSMLCPWSLFRNKQSSFSNLVSKHNVRKGYINMTTIKLFKGPLLYCFSLLYYRSQIYTKHVSEVFGSKYPTGHAL